MGSKQRIIDNRLENTEDKDPDRQEILDTQITNKTSEEISTYLTNIPPGEIGGLTAISGFYYQFLVTIEYIIEMLEGKWDYVIMEHHDDVVVGKGNKIRFIQVKTSEKIKLDVTESPASGLYTRKKKKDKKDKEDKEDNRVSHPRNNSWVDKLISNAELAPKSADFRTEFQLYASYHFMKTRDFDFDIYTGNKGYEIAIPPKDNLFEKISAPVWDKDGVPYDYEVSCEETTKQLLSRFYIHTGSSLSEIDLFKNHLCMKLNKFLFKDIGPGITMQVEDLHMLIGHLCTKCTYKNNPEILLITKKSVEDILSEVRTKSIAAASIATNKHDSVQVTIRVVEELLKEYEDSEHINLIRDKLYNYRDYLMEWISNGGDIRGLLERYIDGTNRTSVYSRLGDTDRESRLQELFCVVLILTLGRDSLLQFTSNKGILSTQCEKTKEIFSFLSLEKKKKLPIGLEKLESILQSSDPEEHLFWIDKEIHIIIQNYNDREFQFSRKQVLNIGKKIEVPQLEDDAKLNEVSLTANIIPGDMLNADFLDALDEEVNILESLMDIWGTYEGGPN